MPFPSKCPKNRGNVYEIKARGLMSGRLYKAIRNAASKFAFFIAEKCWGAKRGNKKNKPGTA
ncbi:hypothetical protein YWA314_14774 [Yersinia enterocolitica subsp. enterocolitica WA-314]|nr:hypothetical protein YWA314_14774 [Yersinia enterocolitica subsp. enterocolitica WA-314]